MFIDICYPNGKENEFLVVAKKLGTSGLCFINNKTSFSLDLRKNVCFSDFDKKSNVKDCIYILQNLSNEKKFNAPTKITQVYIKDLNVVAISFNELLKKPENCEKIKFIVKMCEKYKLKIIIGSFAKSPYDLRSEKELLAVSRYLGLKKINSFYSLLTEGF